MFYHIRRILKTCEDDKRKQMNRLIFDILIFNHNVNLNNVVFLEPLFKITNRVGSMV